LSQKSELGGSEVEISRTFREKEADSVREYVRPEMFTYEQERERERERQGVISGL